MGAAPEGVQDWWEQFLGRPAAQEFWNIHPWLAGKQPRDLKYHLPVMLFDDSGPVSSTRSTYCRVWYSLLGTGSEVETRILISSGLKGGPEEDKSWPPLLASFEELAGPVGPGEWGDILLFMGADLEYVCNDLGLPHCNSASAMCCCCEADTTGTPHNTFHADARWRGTLVSKEQQLFHRK